ncbi:hypothetical protein KI387_002450, partial [Taxus chinensis]
MATIVPPISNDYNVHILSTEVVVPALQIQRHILSLTNLDLTIPPVSVHVFLCYKNTSHSTFASALSHLKIFLCNSKGVRFTQAYDATSFAHLNLYNPDESVPRKLESCIFCS